MDKNRLDMCHLTSQTLQNCKRSTSKMGKIGTDPPRGERERRGGRIYRQKEGGQQPFLGTQIERGEREGGVGGGRREREERERERKGPWTLTQAQRKREREKREESQ